jgi:hypothetical protein
MANDAEANKSLHSRIDQEINKIERSACLSSDIKSSRDEFTRAMFQSGLDWLTGFIMRPHAELGRHGAVCPFAQPAHCEGALVFCAWDVEELPFEIFLSVLIGVPGLYHRMLARMPVKSKLFSVCIFLNGLNEDQYFRYIDEAHSLTKPFFMDEGLMIGEFHPLSMTKGARSTAFRPMRSNRPVFVVRAITPHDALFIDRDGSPVEVRLRELLTYRLWVEDALPPDDLLRIEKRISELRAALDHGGTADNQWL